MAGSDVLVSRLDTAFCVIRSLVAPMINIYEKYL